MAGSTYSTNLKIELMTTGENSGTWGDITNTNLGTALEQAVVGYGNPDYVSDANLTISITNSNAAQPARALVLNVTSTFGSLTQTRELVVPTIQKQYIVQNNTTGGQSITVKTSAGTGITVPNGRKAHLYVNGTDVIQMFDFVDINGGAIDNTPIGVSNSAAGAFTTLNASGATTLDGNVTLGNASGDTVTVTGTIASNLLFTDNTYDIGASGATRPRNLFLAGAATIGGNLSVGGTLTLTGGVNLNGNVTVGDSAADTLTINSTVTSNLIFTDNTYDIGASGATRPRNLFLAGNATIGGAQTLTGALTVDSTTDSSSTTTGSIQTDGGLGVAKSVFVGGTVNTVGLTVNLATTSDAAQIRGSTTGSSNLLLQSSAGTGVAWWISGKTSGILSIGGNGGSEPALGAINIGSTGNVSVGATSGSGLFQVGTPASSTGSLRAFSSYVSVDANYQSANVYGTSALPALIFGGDDNTGIWHPASDVIAFSNAGGETARFDASKNFVIGATATNGKITAYGGTVGATATSLTPIETIWMDYAGGIGDNRGSGPSFVFSTSNAPSNLGKSAAIGAPSEDSEGLSRVVGLSFWTSSFDANRAEVGRFTGNYGSFLVGNTALYGVGSAETSTIQVKGGLVWAANNTASANNRNWIAGVNGYQNGSLDFTVSSTNTGWPNSFYGLSLLRTGDLYVHQGDVIAANGAAEASIMFRAYEVGAGGNNAGFSCGIAGAKGSIYGASGVAGLSIVGGNPGLINFGYSTGDTSLYANYSSLGTWSPTGLGVGTANPGSRLHTNSSGLGDRGGIQIQNSGAGGSSFFIWPTATINGEGANKLIIGGDVGNIMAIFGATGQVLMGVTAAPATAPAGLYVSKNSASYGVIGARNGSGRNTFSVIGDSNFDCGYVGTSSPSGTDALLEVNGGNGVRFTVSASERGRFLGNDFMVGTTSTSGSISNDIGSITGRTKTASGTFITVGGGAWYSAFTISNPGLYIVHAYIGGYNAGPNDWSNAWFITYTGANSAFVSPSVFGATGNVQCRVVSSVNVEIYAGAGSGITYSWVVQRIG